MTVQSWSINVSNERKDMTEWTMISLFVYVAYIETSFPVFQYYDILKGSLSQNITCNVSPLFHHQCGNTKSVFYFKKTTYIMLDGDLYLEFLSTDTILVP
jgi:hypothetical protein